MFSAPPNYRMQAHYKTILTSIIQICDASLRNGATEAVEDNNGTDIAVTFDGTRQKCDFQIIEWNNYSEII